MPTDSTLYNYFNSIKAVTDVKFGKAKALNDISIAILSVQDYYADMLMDLLYESSSYCTILSTYLGKYSQCIQGSDYSAFKADTKNAGKTALVYLAPSDITSDLLLTSDGIPRFDLLIVADYYLGSTAAINTKLGASAIAKIVSYTNAGGMIYASGKGGYLLETWGLLTSGLYNTDYLLTSSQTNQAEQTTGCSTVTNVFESDLLCMNLAASSTYGTSFLLSAYMMNKDKASKLTTVMSYNSQSTTL